MLSLASTPHFVQNHIVHKIDPGMHFPTHFYPAEVFFREDFYEFRCQRSLSKKSSMKTKKTKTKQMYKYNEMCVYVSSTIERPRIILHY